MPEEEEEEELHREKKSQDTRDDNSSPPQWYLNSLLPAMGYLDFTNALDFPANVWNSMPLPFFAKVLMAIGGSIAILSTFFAFWDLRRSRRNIAMLRHERRKLLKEKTKGGMQQAWLAVNARELGWEYIDRMAMDVFMALAGILVGTGCLMAIRGDIPAVYLASNVLSGYLGNSFVALYALMNISWSVFMWRRAHLVHVAETKVKEKIDAEILGRLREHARGHKLYATVSGVTMFVSGVGSEVSSTKWEGYVVLIPAVLGSVFCNWYWRYWLGYDRLSYQDREVQMAAEDVQSRLQCVMEVREMLSGKNYTDIDFEQVELQENETLRSLLSDLGASEILDMPAEKWTQHERRKMIDGLRLRLRGEERFLLELYGYYIHQTGHE